jgi:hypothetical protein
MPRRRTVRQLHADRIAECLPHIAKLLIREKCCIEEEVIASGMQKQRKK